MPSPPTDLCDLTARELAAHLREKRVSAREVMINGQPADFDASSMASYSVSGTPCCIRASAWSGDRSLRIGGFPSMKAGTGKPVGWYFQPSRSCILG